MLFATLESRTWCTKSILLEEKSHGLYLKIYTKQMRKKINANLKYIKLFSGTDETVNGL